MPALPTQNKRVVLAERPDRGPITEKTFKLETAKVENLQDGQIMVKVLYTSIVSSVSSGGVVRRQIRGHDPWGFARRIQWLWEGLRDREGRRPWIRADLQDPTMRNWLNAARSYMRPIDIGEPMRAAGIGRVVDSKSKTIAVGDLVCPSSTPHCFRTVLRYRYMGLLIGRNIGLGEMIKLSEGSESFSYLSAAPCYQSCSGGSSYSPFLARDHCVQYKDRNRY